MTKLDFAGLSNLLASCNNSGIITSTRVRYDNRANGRRYYGTRCVIDKPLTAEARAALEGCPNVTLASCHYRYAPEQRHDTVTLLDNARRVVFAGAEV